MGGYADSNFTVRTCKSYCAIGHIEYYSIGPPVSVEIISIIVSFYWDIIPDLHNENQVPHRSLSEHHYRKSDTA